jgi:hypothetical protein
MKSLQIKWAAIAVLGLSTAAARADVTWEHTGTVRISNAKAPLGQIKLYNTWTPQRHRVLLKYAVSPKVASLPMRSMDMFPVSTLAPAPRGNSGFKNFGSIGFVQRLDDDRVLAYDSQTRHYISEPRRALLQRLRFDPWKKLAPELSAQAPPTLTRSSARV